MSDKKEEAPAFQFYVKDWRSSRAVMRMSFAQRGMYLEMLLEQWESFTVPDNPEECSELIGGSADEWREAWPSLRRKFVSDTPGRMHNTRLERVRRERRRFTKQAQVAGKKGGAARAKSAKRRDDGTYAPSAHPDDIQTGIQTPNQANPDTASSSSTASATASASDRTSTGTGTREEGSYVDQRTTGAEKLAPASPHRTALPPPSKPCQFSQLCAIAKSIAGLNPTLLANQADWKEELRATVTRAGFASPDGDTLRRVLDAVDYVIQKQLRPEFAV